MFALLLVLSALPVAAVSFNRQVSLTNTNGGGTNFVNLSASATTFCYLSRVLIEETDITGEFAGCRLTRGSIVWTLEAIAGSSGSAGDQDAYCTAICYNN
jgi:hypothetical protein